ncbi:MAG TPA: serine hydrolase domain-containing protein [Candidatus Baltobacteraceae bacterium]|nr:serine hydrolase domain-containing protein [Candidatus Baltobacteraceae bacterium]
MNRIFASAFAAAIVLTCAPVVAPTAQAQSVATGGGLTAAQRTEIDLVGQRSVDDHGAPSVDITVLRDGRVVYQRGFGLRNVEDSVPPDAWTRYPIGSNTKQFTAASILMLQDEGKLHVDDPLAKYLPEIPHARRVTLRNLLMHTGGYAEFTEIGSFDEIGARPATPAQVVGSVVSRPLGFTPGTKRQYSNTGYILLQMVIERLSGMPYAEFVQRHIFTPLGMTASYVRTYDDTKPDVATEYSDFALGPWEHATHLDYTWFGGAGAIVTNAADLAKWNAGLDGGKLLSPRSLKEMMTPVKIDANFPDYGFGIMNTKLPNGHRMISHGGNTFGAATQDARFPDDHLAIIVLANSGTYNYDAAVSAIYSTLVPSPKAAKPHRHAPKAPAAKPPAMAATAKAWLESAIAGHIDMAALRPDFRARMSPLHRASLRALRRFGPRTYTFVSSERRAPSTSYLFQIATPKEKLIYVYARDDDGSVGGVAVIPSIDFTPPKGTPTNAQPSPSPSAPATAAP